MSSPGRYPIVRRPWPPVEDALLRSLYPSPDYSLEEIASMVNRSVSAVESRAQDVLHLHRSRQCEVRRDPVGPWLVALGARAGGRAALARLLNLSHRASLDRLIRTDLVPRNAVILKLAEISGETIESVRLRFGVRLHPGTAAAIAATRERFPRDRARLAVARAIEEDLGTVAAYAAAVDMNVMTLHMWLSGKTLRLSKRDLAKIAKRENLFSRGARIPVRMTAETSLRTRARLMRRKKLRKKRHPAPSKESRERLSETAKARWANPEWRRKTGARVIGVLNDAWGRLRADEYRWLAYLVKHAVGTFRSLHRSASPNDILVALCRILGRHRQRFPQSSLTFEALPERVDAILGKPLRAILRARGHPHDVSEIATVIRLFAKTPRPDPFWPEASLALYSNRDRADVTRDRWNHIEKSISAWSSKRTADPPVDLLHRLFEAILGRVLDPDTVRNALRLAPGRPVKTPLAPV